MKAIVICRTSGEYLLDLILDSEINPLLLSSFIGALSLFGKENMGKIEELNIKGLDLEMIVVSKYDLIFIAIIDKQYVRELVREEAEKALEMFYLLYKDEIQDSVDTSIFDSFKKILILQIKEYLDNFNQPEQEIEDTQKSKDFGLWEIFEKCRDKLENN